MQKHRPSSQHTKKSTSKCSRHRVIGIDTYNARIQGLEDNEPHMVHAPLDHRPACGTTPTSMGQCHTLTHGARASSVAPQHARAQPSHADTRRHACTHPKRTRNWCISASARVLREACAQRSVSPFFCEHFRKTPACPTCSHITHGSGRWALKMIQKKSRATH